MLILVLAALADSGDTADTGDTGAYVDTGAKAEEVYEQSQVGCGEGSAAAALIAFVPLLRRHRARPNS